MTPTKPADAATPGPWTDLTGAAIVRYGHGGGRVYFGGTTTEPGRDLVMDLYGCDGPDPAARREAILAAVNSHARHLQAIADLRGALESVVAIAKEAHAEWDADNDPRVGKILIALSGGCPGYRKDIDDIHATLAATQET